MFIDTHTHFGMCLEDKSLSEEELLSRMEENRIGFSVQVSTEIEEFEWSYNFAKRNKGVYFTIGIHPSSKAGERELAAESDFVEKVMGSEDKPLVFGLGEFGLDFFRMHQPKDMQIRSFEYQLDLADKYKLPAIIHSREAKEDTLNILKRKRPVSAIMHCFAGDSRDVKEYLDLGFYISFAGNLTYKNATNLQDAARHVPLDRLLLETDAPFLTPVPLRGQKNFPDYVVHTYRYFADLRKEPLSRVEDIIHENFLKIINEKG